jgi:hypothetical protein
VADDPLAAALAGIRERNGQLRTRYGHVGGLLVLAKAERDVPRLLAAVEAVLEEVHALSVLVSYWQPCPVHSAQREEFGGPWQRQPFASRAEADCPGCGQVEYVGCDGCRNEAGHPSRPEECPTRTGITSALLGEEKPDACPGG